MASEKYQPSLVNYDMMPDRGLTLPEEDSEFVPGDQLKLNVQDWKPHKVAAEPPGPSWMDPKKDPRFGKEKKPDYVGDDDLDVHLNYDYTKPREGLHVLNMKNIPSRWIDQNEDSQILRMEMLGNDQVEKKQQVHDAIEEDRMIRAGEEMQSKKKRSSSYVNMKQQLNRPVNINQTDAPDVQYQVNDLNKERRDVNIMNWDVIPGRESRIITKEKIHDLDRYSDDEEVQISPKVATLSRSI
jgi:hypothetical protein